MACRHWRPAPRRPGAYSFSMAQPLSPSAPTHRVPRWLWISGALLTAVLVAVGVALSQVPSDEALARRAETELSAALGVPVSVGALHWHLRPGLRIELENVATQQALPVQIRQLNARLNLRALWQKRLKVERIEVDGAMLPQLSLRALQTPQAADRRTTPAVSPGGFQLDALPLAELVFNNVTWISRYGTHMVYAGQVQFDAAWRPRTAELRRPGVTPAADLSLTRQGDADHWDVLIHLGGGTATGDITLSQPESGGLQLTGRLRDSAVDLEAAMAAFNRRSIVAGKAEGDTTLSARGKTLPELVRSLHTTTQFRVSPATLLRFDLEQAIRSAGKEHNGSTPLQSLSGQLDSQNSANGVVLDFSNVHAASGALTATGHARIAERTIEGELSVDLIDGLVGVPLTVSGPLSRVQVAVPPGAIAGAVVGTAILPGVGTAIGAKLGTKLGKIFSPSAPKKPSKLAPVIRH